MKNKYTKILIIALSLWRIVFITIFPLYVFAEEEFIEPNTSQEIIESGDALSQATTDSETNIAVTEVEVTAPDGEIQIETQEDASVEASSSAESTSGENIIEEPDSEDALILSGDAASLANTNTETNISIVDVSLENNTALEENNEENLEANLSGAIEQDVNIEIITQQDAVVDSESAALSETGQNTIESLSEAEIITGDALAISSTINLANVNLVGTDLVWLITTILGEQEGPINLYDLLYQLTQQGNNVGLTDLNITTNQNANLNVSTLADSSTGLNNICASDGTITTGDSTSIANSVNMVNLNLVASQGVIGIINIVGTLIGNIILPSSESLANSYLFGDSSVITNQNAYVDSLANSESESGLNQLSGNGSISTGDATSISNNYSYLNLVRIGGGWGWIIVNLFGNWDGTVNNWSEPGSLATLDQGTNLLEKEWDGNANPEGANLSVYTDQNANVLSNTSALSNSGNNNINGDGTISTGDALSVANSFDLVNFVGVGGSYFFGVINIFGNWIGNLVFAYPDLEVSINDGKDKITAGSSNEYSISVTNKGDSEANGVSLNFSSSNDFISSDNTNSFDLGDIKSGETRELKINGNISSTALANTTVSASAQVSATNSEESGENNKSTDLTLVYIPEENKDNRLPSLTITSWNNVNEFVYPGDTVRSKIVVANQSAYIAHSVKVEGSLSNDHPMPAIPMGWELGDLKPGEVIEIDFSIGLIDELPDGQYHISAQAKGKSEKGDESSTGWVSSSFMIKLKGYVSALSTEVLADNRESGKVLGNNTNWLVDNRKYLPYILGTSLLLLLFIYGLRRKADGKRFLPILIKKKKDNEK